MIQKLEQPFDYLIKRLEIKIDIQLRPIKKQNNHLKINLNKGYLFDSLQHPCKIDASK